MIGFVRKINFIDDENVVKWIKIMKNENILYVEATDVFWLGFIQQSISVSAILFRRHQRRIMSNLLNEPTFSLFWSGTFLVKTNLCEKRNVFDGELELFSTKIYANLMNECLLLFFCDKNVFVTRLIAFSRFTDFKLEMKLGWFMGDFFSRSHS